jgi:chlorophyllase
MNGGWPLMMTSQSWRTDVLRQRVRSETIHRMRFGFCAPLAAFLVAISGCVQPPGCPQAPGRAATTLATTSDPVYVGKGDPYSNGLLAIRRLSTAACEQGNIVPLLILSPDAPGNYPVVVFQHGFITRNEAYSEILSHLASHGFVVVAPQMYEPGLAALLGQPTAADEALTAAQVLSWLTAGLPATLAYSPETSRLGLAGHSRGGKVAWLMLVANPSRVQAVAGVDPVDGTGGPFGNQARVVQGPFSFSLPTLVIGTGLGGNCAPAGDNHEQFYAASRSPAWHVVIPDAGHADMLDEATAISASGVCPGGPDRAAVRRLTAGLLVAFFRGSLQGDASAYTYLTDVADAPMTIEVESK